MAARAPSPWLCLLLALGVAVALGCSAEVPEPTQEELLALFQQNLKRYRAFKCRTPQKRSVSLRPLLLGRELLRASQEVLPSSTVLHVCAPSTGCCSRSDMICAPADTEVVTLTFQVRDDVRQSAAPDLRLNFRNHTRCECVSRSGAARDYEAVDLLGTQ